MKKTVLPLLLSLLFVAVACSSDTEAAADADPPTSAAASTSAEIESEVVETTNPLQGAWSTSITPQAYAAFIVSTGVDETIATQITSENLAGPDFRLEFLADRFRLSYTPTDDQYMSGTFSVEGDQVTLDDEAPVGVYTWRFAVDGDTLVFSEGTTSNPEIELIPGVPDFLPGDAFLSSAPWTSST